MDETGEAWGSCVARRGGALTAASSAGGKDSSGLRQRWVAPRVRQARSMLDNGRLPVPDITNSKSQLDSNMLGKFTIQLLRTRATTRHLPSNPKAPPYRPLEDPLLLHNPLPPLHTLPLRPRPRLARHPKEQARVLPLLQQMAHVPPVRRIPIILDIPPRRRVGKPVLEAARPRLLQHALDVLLADGQRLVRVQALALQQPQDRKPRVVARRDLAAGLFDGLDG